MTTVLAFDYGNKLIGIAVGQRITQTASPLVTLERKHGPPWPAIATLIEQWQPSWLLVGLPLGRDGEEQPITLAARQFAATLRNKFANDKLGCDFVDERYSSQAAEQLVSKNKTMAKSGKRWDRNAVAAMLLAESWLYDHPL